MSGVSDNMMVLSVLNKKGGVGKTTISTNLGQLMSILGDRVLMIDNDAQHNLSSTLGLMVADCPVTLADVMKAPVNKFEKMVARSIYETPIPGLDCVAGSLELDLLSPPPAFFKKFLASQAVQAGKYDVVIIDNSPSISLKTQSAIMASTLFLIPVILDQFSVDGLVELFDLLTKSYKVDTQRIFILRNMCRNIKMYNRVSEELEEFYKNNLLETVIPYDLAFDRILLDVNTEKSITGWKSLFFSHTTANATLKIQNLICEIFGYDKMEMLDELNAKIKEHRADIGRETAARMKERRARLGIKSTINKNKKETKK